MRLEIISSHETLFDGEVSSVTLPGELGQFTVLKNHASLLSVLVKGEVIYATDEGYQIPIKIDGGVADVDNNVISVCIY